MHLIFNYCLLHHHAQWENVKACNPQCFKQQPVRRDHRALVHIYRHAERDLNIEYELKHFPARLCSVDIILVNVKGILQMTVLQDISQAGVLMQMC